MKIANVFLASAMLAVVGLSAQYAQAATYTCIVEKTTGPHPYLPARIEFQADSRFNAVIFNRVEIKNVTTPPSKGVVENRTRKRLRLSWPSSEYVLEGVRPRQPGSYGRLRPENYRYTLSLNLTNGEFITRIVDTRSATSNGSAQGHCQLRE